jgi:hypothetical protein
MPMASGYAGAGTAAAATAEAMITVGAIERGTRVTRPLQPARAASGARANLG